MPTSCGKFVILSTQIVLGLLVNVLLLGWAGGMCEEPACAQLAASFSHCTGCGKYSHHLSVPTTCVRVCSVLKAVQIQVLMSLDWLNCWLFL